MSHPLQWEFPGGKLQEGENYKDALKREILEELGVEISIKEKLNDCNYDYGSHQVVLSPYLCQLLSVHSIKLSEHRQYKWIDIKDWMQFAWLDADVGIVEELISKNL